MVFDKFRKYENELFKCSHFELKSANFMVSLAVEFNRI